MTIVRAASNERPYRDRSNGGRGVRIVNLSPRTGATSPPKDAAALVPTRGDGRSSSGPRGRNGSSNIRADRPTNATALSPRDGTRGRGIVVFDRGKTDARAKANAAGVSRWRNARGSTRSLDPGLDGRGSQGQRDPFVASLTPSTTYADVAEPTRSGRDGAGTDHRGGRRGGARPLDTRHDRHVDRYRCGHSGYGCGCRGWYDYCHQYQSFYCDQFRWYAYRGFRSGFWRPWRRYSLCYDYCRVDYAYPWQSYPAFGYDSVAAEPVWYAAYRTSSPTYSTPYEPLLPTIDQAWGLLADDQLALAEETFAELVYAAPNDPLPRIGFALTTGLLGELDASVRSMRTAVGLDASSLADVPDDEGVLIQIDHLLDPFLGRARDDKNDLDAMFMISALRFITDEPALAYHALDTAISGGDDSESAASLKTLLDAVLYEHYQ